MQALFRTAGITFFNVLKGRPPAMDPITATQNAIAQFFGFLATPAGQRVVDDFRAIDQAFIGKLKDLFDKIHGQVTGTPTK